MYRTMVIGVGGRGQTWARAVRDHSLFDLTALADLDQQLLAKSVENLDVAGVETTTDFKSMLEAGRIDVVINVASTTAHYAITKAVLESNVHCLVEKPFTLDIGEAEELVKIADDRKLTLVVGQNYRFKGMCRFIAESIAERRMGDLIEVTGHFHRNRPPRPTDRNIEFPMLFIQGVHHIDWLQSIVPGPLQLHHAAHHLPADSPWASPTVCHLAMSGAGGVPVSYSGNYDARGVITPYSGLWRFAFTDGDLLIEADRQIWKQTKDGERESAYEQPDDEPSSEHLLLDSVHTSIADGTEAPTSGRRNIELLKLLFEILETGKR